MRYANCFESSGGKNEKGLWLFWGDSFKGQARRRRAVLYGAPIIILYQLPTASQARSETLSRDRVSGRKGSLLVHADPPL
jgi:hypothetical protein